MAAFDRIRSGIAQMDQALDSIRLGDNVVWRVSDLAEFQVFALPFLRQAVSDGRRAVYVRFAEHAPVISMAEAKRLGIIVEQVELSHRFETFTVDVHNLITRHGRGACYVFDCLSELQTAWATDLMMGNFFQVTCPYLFQVDTVAYFPLLRGRHSLAAQKKIQNTAQLLLDVYEADGQGERGADPLPDRLYVRPAKVWKRDAQDLFAPHLYCRTEGTFRPVTDGVGTNRFYKVLERHQRSGEEQSSDSWDRFFRRTRQRMEAGEDVSDACVYMCRIMMTRDEHMRKLIRAYFGPEDFFRVRDRMIGTGMIGGKACGMLTARKILDRDAPEVAALLEMHDSFYIGSDVFYSFLVDNGFWDLRVRQRTKEEYFSLADEFARKIRTGTFDGRMEDQFHFLLDRYGQDPYIVRSSSILEDGFGNAFAGKYESVFCANTGSEQERLRELEDAVRTVYASTMDRSALEYRKRRGLDGRDEQMALLVQRVSGTSFGRYFMPCAAGVGYSMSPYRVRPATDPAAGMLRLVAGLGTAAVDRTEGSYPRIVALDHPQQGAAGTSAARHRFSQRRIEVIDRREKCVASILPEQILGSVPPYVKAALLEHDTDAERTFRDRGQRREVTFVSCAGLAENRKLMRTFRTMLSVIGKAYDYPVDTEFTVNLAPDGDFVINLLQCRPLQAFHDTGAGTQLRLPQQGEYAPEDVLFECRHTTMGVSCGMRLDGIVYVDPVGYYRMPYAKKPDVARLIGKISRAIAVREEEEYRTGEGAGRGGPSQKEGRSLHVLLMVPGRIGTSSPELGVPVSYADISSFSGICEMAESRIGYNPELSYGSHMFQDLVEAQILYAALFENRNTIAFHPERIRSLKNELPAVLSSSAGRGMEDIVHVCCLSEAFQMHFPACGGPGPACMLYHDMQKEHLLCLMK